MQEALRFFTGISRLPWHHERLKMLAHAVRVDNYVSEKQMWAVTLMVQPDAAARRRNILVRARSCSSTIGPPRLTRRAATEHLRLGA